MRNLTKIKLDKRQRSLLTAFLAAVILLEFAWALGFVSKPALAPTEQETVVVPQASLGLLPSSGTFAVEETFEVEIVLQVEDDVATDGVDVQFLFDPEMLEVIDVSSLDFYPQRLELEADNEKGIIQFAAASTPDQEEIKGGGVMGIITFKALQAGETQLIFGNSAVAASGLDLLSQTSDGVYTVN